MFSTLHYHLLSLQSKTPSDWLRCLIVPPPLKHQASVCGGFFAFWVLQDIPEVYHGWSSLYVPTFKKWFQILDWVDRGTTCSQNSATTALKNKKTSNTCLLLPMIGFFSSNFGHLKVRCLVQVIDGSFFHW